MTRKPFVKLIISVCVCVDTGSKHFITVAAHKNIYQIPITAWPKQIFKPI